MNRTLKFVPYALAAYCIVSGIFGISSYLKGFAASDNLSGMVSSWQQRLQPLRHALPADLHVMGYLQASDIPGSTQVADEAELFLTQYALAPVALKHSMTAKWIVGNFGGSAPLETIKPWLDRTLGQYTLQDFGFGIYLIHVMGP